MVPRKDQATTVDWAKKAPTPIASVLGSQSSSNSPMERLLQEVMAFVLRSAPGAAEAAAQSQHQQHPHQQSEPSLSEPSSCTSPWDPTERALLRIKKDPAFQRTKNAGYWDRHHELKGLCH